MVLLREFKKKFQSSPKNKFNAKNGKNHIITLYSFIFFFKYVCCWPCFSLFLHGFTPIQFQVQAVVKCFDKLWLQATTNSLYEAGMTNNMLNLLHLENEKARVAVKVNNRLTKSITVTDVELQGSVWGSLKCTTLMDTLNKIILPQSHMTYKYKGDKI